MTLHFMLPYCQAGHLTIQFRQAKQKTGSAIGKANEKWQNGDVH